MGTWSNKPFGNDTARDWAWGLETAESRTRLDAAIRDVLSCNDEVDAKTAEVSVGAALIIAAAACEPIRGVPKEIGAWIRTSGYVPSKRLVNDAVQALDIVMANSELRSLWVESGGLEGWLRSTGVVRERLVTAIPKGLPERTPRKPGMPRSLHKLLERYEKEPTDAVLTRIRKKIDKIDDPNSPTHDTAFKLPLSLLAEHGLIDEVKILLDKGADPVNSQTNIFSMSPFDAACSGNHIELAELLRGAGARVFTELEPRDVEIICEQLEVDSVDELFENNRFCLALFTAARQGSAEVVEYLLSLGANLAQTDFNGETLLHKSAEGGNVQMVKYLISAGLDVNRRKSRNDEVPLHYAVRGGSLECVLLLLENGADPNVIEKYEGTEDRWYNTPLDFAIGGRKKKPEIAAALRDFGGMTAQELREDSSS